MVARDLEDNVFGDRLQPVVCEIWFPQGPDTAWRISHLRGTESISAIYEFEIDIECDDPSAADDDLLGVDCELRLDRNGMARSIYGIVDNVEILTSAEPRLGPAGVVARIRLVPALRLLDQNIDTRFFTGQTVVEIVAESLGSALSDYQREVDSTTRIRGEHPRLDYCVQFRESTLGFCERILEEAGIAYVFAHDESARRETLVLIDNNEDYEAVDLVVPGAIPIVLSRPEQLSHESLQALAWRRGSAPNRVIVRSYNSKVPAALDEGEATREDSTRPHLREVYHDGDFHQIIDDPVDDPRAQSFTGADLEQSPKRARQLLDRHILEAERGHGRGNAIGFAAGLVVLLGEHPDPDLEDQRLLLTHVTHEAAHAAYFNQFECVRADRVFVPARRTPKPRVYGVQTAVVVGPKPDEIYADKFGRVKVAFHLDRHGEADEYASCWLRVVQSWAGSGYGAMVIPRVGMEVIVTFIDGNPDCPIVTGCVYNGANLPPYTLPDEVTKSTFKTRSSPDGDGFHEIRIEDAADNEQLFVHAQRRMDLRVRGALFESCGGSREEVIGGDGNGDPHGDHNTLVHRDFNHHVARTHYAKIDEQVFTVVGEDRIDDLQARHIVRVGDLSQLTAARIVREAKEVVHLKADTVALFGSTTISCKAGDKVVIESNNAIELKVGSSFISITDDGVSIRGLMIRLNSGGGVGTALETDDVCTPEIVEAIDAYSADDGRPAGPGQAGRGRGRGGGRSHKRRSLIPHRAPPIKPKPARPKPRPDDFGARRFLNLEWGQAEVWCSEVAILWGATQNYAAGDTETVTVTNAGDGSVERAVTRPVETDRFNQPVEIVDILPRRRNGSVEPERLLNASAAGTITEAPLRLRFLTSLARKGFLSEDHQFDLELLDNEIRIGGTIPFVKGELHFLILLGEYAPADARGMLFEEIDAAFGWRYARYIDFELHYWAGDRWVLVPPQWSNPDGADLIGVAVWREGDQIKTMYGEMPWPDPVIGWTNESLEAELTLLDSLANAVNQFWSYAFDLRRQDCKSSNMHCCRHHIRCMIRFVETDRLTSEAIVMGDSIPSRADSRSWHIAEDDTAIHEFGHLLGNPDEYPGATVIDATVNTDGAVAGIDEASIMGGGHIIRRRHFDTVNRIFTSRVFEDTGRGFTYLTLRAEP